MANVKYSIAYHGLSRIKGESFRRIMKSLVVGVGFALPIIFGIWRYQTTSEPYPHIDAIFWTVLSSFFSIGLWLSVLRFGKRVKYLTLILILLGIPFHIMFSVYPFFFLPVVIVVELYAIGSLFFEE